MAAAAVTCDPLLCTDLYSITLGGEVVMSSGHVPWVLFPVVALIGFCVVHSGSKGGYTLTIFGYMDSASS